MPVKLEIYLLDSKTEAKGTIYLDDGNTFRYQEINESILVKIGFDPQTNTLWT